MASNDTGMNLPKIRTELVAMSKTADLHGQKLLAYLIEMAILEIDEQLSMRMQQSFREIEQDAKGKSDS
jgi:hypothetical protein